MNVKKKKKGIILRILLIVISFIVFYPIAIFTTTIFADTRDSKTILAFEYITDPKIVLKYAQKMVRENRQKYKLCPSCGGEGSVLWRSGFRHKCKVCKGKGYVEKWMNLLAATHRVSVSQWQPLNTLNLIYPSRKKRSEYNATGSCGEL